jgi:hypothetical protein
VVHPKLWPESKSPIGIDARIEDRIDGLLKRMTVEEKVGQVVQPFGVRPPWLACLRLHTLALL